jgi:hypothetical protein
VQRFFSALLNNNDFKLSQTELSPHLKQVKTIHYYLTDKYGRKVLFSQYYNFIEPEEEHSSSFFIAFLHDMVVWSKDFKG